MLVYVLLGQFSCWHATKFWRIGNRCVIAAQTIAYHGNCQLNRRRSNASPAASAVTQMSCLNSGKTVTNKKWVLKFFSLLSVSYNIHLSQFFIFMSPGIITSAWRTLRRVCNIYGVKSFFYILNYFVGSLRSENVRRWNEIFKDDLQEWWGRT